jgi:hypothetical protein
MMNLKDVDPKIKRFFPWALFLVLAALFAVGACSMAHAGGLWPREDKPSLSISDWTCERVRAYLATHTEAEARAQAAELHLPKWVIRRAERCVQ